jgi:hypothetical protein
MAELQTFDCISNGVYRSAKAKKDAAMAADEIEGRCLCGSVHFKSNGTPNWTVHCHCESCRRATSSPVTTWVSVPKTNFAFTKGSPRYFSSSQEVRRGFCENCGSPLTYENKSLPDEVHFYAASLIDASGVSPSKHVYVSEQLPWLEVADQLPRFATTSQGGTSPIRTGSSRT